MATRTAHQRWRTRRPAFPKVCNPVPTNSVNGAKRSSRQCRQRPPQSPKTVQPRVTQPHPRGRKQTTTTTRGGPRRDRNRDITAARCLRLPSPTCRHSATTRVCLNTTTKDRSVTATQHLGRNRPITRHLPRYARDATRRRPMTRDLTRTRHTPTPTSTCPLTRRICGLPRRTRDFPRRLTLTCDSMRRLTQTRDLTRRHTLNHSPRSSLNRSRARTTRNHNRACRTRKRPPARPHSPSPRLTS